MAVFGRYIARQRLRRATQQSLEIPALHSPVDCAPWVIGELWPAELSTGTGANATLAQYLRSDLELIVRAANQEIRRVRTARLPAPVQQAQEARVVDGARAAAAQRVEAALRQLRQGMEDFPTDRLPPFTPAPTDGPSGEDTEEFPVVTAEPQPAETDQPDDLPPTDEAAEEHSDLPAAPAGPAVPAAQPGPDSERLQRLVEFMARQEPGLRWAAGDRANRTTVVTTDIADGWIPPGVAVPADVRLLPPGRRAGDVAALLGHTTVWATYAPGDPLGWSFGWETEFDPTASSVKPRRLPPVDNLGWLLCGATQLRDGLPPTVHTLARSGAERTGIDETEVAGLREHLDDARVQLLAGYPDIDHVLLLNCMLLASTEGIATGDWITANYHFAWYQVFNSAAAGKHAAPV